MQRSNESQEFFRLDDIPPRDGDSSQHWDFKYAPPKPEGEPWKMILEPLLRKDNMQCNVWKDEVQNLLIFAGLFSAVVTAFVVESYKTLQPDPEDTMITLLSQIATGLNKHLDDTSLTTSSDSFIVSRSSIRINICWFISLVLSLTTVLVGIVSLQWLREYQSYPDLTPQQTFAVFHMRERSLRKWHISTIFTVLPLLLQVALILFFVGMIDFVLSFSIWVSVPVIFVIGMTLSFLLLTTILPTVQLILLYLPSSYPKDDIAMPNPCPYKSPQSHSFRMLASLFFKNHRLSCGFRLTLHNLFADNSKSERLRNQHEYFTSCLSKAISRKTWAKLDLDWLMLRDRYTHAVKVLSGSHPSGQDLVTFPIFDAAAGIQDAIRGYTTKGNRPYTSALYHCFTELSHSAILPHSGDTYLADKITESHHLYFQRLFHHDPTQIYLIQRVFTTPNSKLLHLENLSIFIKDVLIYASTDHVLKQLLRMHLTELRLQAMKTVLTLGCTISPAFRSSDRLPVIIKVHVMDMSPRTWLLNENEERKIYLCIQYLEMVESFFQFADSKTPDWSKSIYAHHSIPNILFDGSTLILDFYEYFSSTPERYCLIPLKAVLGHIHERLRLFLNNISSVDPHTYNMNLIFYTGALFLRPLIRNPSYNPVVRDYIGTMLTDVANTLVLYQRKVLQDIGPDIFLEERFQGTDGVRFLTNSVEFGW